MSKISNVHKAIIAVIIANIVWGFTPPIFKWALEDVSLFTLAFFRFFLAALIFLPFVVKKNLRIERKYWPKVFLMAFAGVFLHITFFFLGLELTTSINAPVIASVGPVF
jgi:drug/metabolite transporter (DMT)-like permease